MWILLIALLSLSAVALPATWVQVQLKYNWDHTSSGLCNQQTQCLVNNQSNPTFDNQPERYWTQAGIRDKPKCITHGQYIADHYCEVGQWTSRTKLVAEQLLQIPIQQGDQQYKLYCDTYVNTLNRYSYVTSYGAVNTFLDRYCTQTGGQRSTCVNNVCVLSYSRGTAFGMALNEDIDGRKSPLQALGYSTTKCDVAKNNDMDYDHCGDNIWYNHNTASIIYSPNATIQPTAASTHALFMDSYYKLKAYVAQYVHNPTIQGFNYDFYDIEPALNFVYFAKQNDKTFYSFKQQNMTRDNTAYAGWYYKNIQLPQQTCTKFIKPKDGNAHCEQQPIQTEFYIATAKTPFDLFTTSNLIDSWHDLTNYAGIS